MVKYTGFGATNDDRSFFYSGTSYSPLDYGVIQDPSGNQWIITGDEWTADMSSSNPYGWDRANSVTKEIHVVIVAPSTGKEIAANRTYANPSTTQLAGFSWKSWNRPMTLLKW